MPYEVEFTYAIGYKDDLKIITGMYLKFDKVIAYIFLEQKYHRLSVTIRTKEEICEKFDLSLYLNSVVDYIMNNQLLCQKKDSLFKEDILKLDNVKYLTLNSANIDEGDVKVLSKLKELKTLSTSNCNFYKNCNLGILKCNILDSSSDIYSLDIFNGFKGHLLRLDESKIENKNNHILHLNNIITTFICVEMDYEYFFLTTDAPNMRKLEIEMDSNHARLTNNDLLFISGFYNLESVTIDAFVYDYKQIERLEKLRRISRIYCTNSNEMEFIRRKDESYVDRLLKANVPPEKIKDFLITKRLSLQNQYQELFHKLYVPRLERVKWEDKISRNDLESIRQELLEISRLSRKERKNISREPKKEFNIFDDCYGLWFDGYQKIEEVVENDSRPFEDNGIRYYTLSRKIFLED